MLLKGTKFFDMTGLENIFFFLIFEIKVSVDECLDQ
jgi:hypothetical protein